MDEHGSADAPGWWVFRGTGAPDDGGATPQLPEPPPWRRFTGWPEMTVPEADPEDFDRRLGAPPVHGLLSRDELDVVNAAIVLRRPLLVTGPPGVGKSTLAHMIARELGLGRVLLWPVVSRTTLHDGLYNYDAIGRAQEAAARRAGASPSGQEHRGQDGRGQDSQRQESQGQEPDRLDIGRFITLGPLGTALLPFERPRVLLVDELDKSDLDLPNDLLHVLENGSYDIPELRRTAQTLSEVFTDDATGVTGSTAASERAPIRHGRVSCAQFPIVVITSNGEREFPAAFRRRCLPLELRPPSRAQLTAIVRAHLRELPPAAYDAVERYARSVESGEQHALDQLLNIVHLLDLRALPSDPDTVFTADGGSSTLVETLLRDLAKGR